MSQVSINCTAFMEHKRISRAILRCRLHNFSEFWTPSPLVCILARFIVINPRNLPYYVCIWVTPYLLSVQTSLIMAPYKNMPLFYEMCVSIIRRSTGNPDRNAYYGNGVDGELARGKEGLLLCRMLWSWIKSYTLIAWITLTAIVLLLTWLSALLQTQPKSLSQA